METLFIFMMNAQLMNLTMKAHLPTARTIFVSFTSKILLNSEKLPKCHHPYFGANEESKNVRLVK